MLDVDSRFNVSVLVVTHIITTTLAFNDSSLIRIVVGKIVFFTVCGHCYDICLDVVFILDPSLSLFSINFLTQNILFQLRICHLLSYSFYNFYWFARIKLLQCRSQIRIMNFLECYWQLTKASIKTFTWKSHWEEGRVGNFIRLPTISSTQSNKRRSISRMFLSLSWPRFILAGLRKKHI